MPGWSRAARDWWAEQRLATHWDTRDAGPRFHAVLELDGAVEGYAIYRIKAKWEQSFPESTVSVVEAFGTSLARRRRRSGASSSPST